MMRRNIFFIACLAFFLATPLFVNAQLHLGASAAINANHTNFRDLTTWSPGARVGIFATYDLTDFLFVTLGGAYSQIGGGYDSGYYYVEPEAFRQNVRTTFNTASVPLFVSVTLPSLASSPVKPLLMAGAEYSYSFYTIESYQNVYAYRGDSYVSSGRSRTTTTHFEAHQPGMLFGAGVALELFGMPATIDLRYRSNFKKQSIENGESVRFKTLSLNVSVALVDL